MSDLRDQLNYYKFDSMGLMYLKNIFSAEQVNNILEKFLENKHKCKYEQCGFIKKYVDFEQLPGIVDLFTDSNLLDVCNNCIGQEFKLDYAVLVEQETSVDQNKSYSVHGGMHKHFNLFYYHSYPQEHITTPCYTQTGQLTVGIPLTEQNLHTGGFCYLPGSHKSSYHIHSEPFFKKHNAADLEDCFVIPKLNQGDCIVFPENLTHGQTSYRNIRPRYAIYAAYYPISMQFNKNRRQRNRLFQNASEHQRIKLYPRKCGQKNLHNVPLF